MADTKTIHALFKAATAGDVSNIRELIAAGAPIDAPDLNRKTPVMLAAQAGRVEAFRVLVELGADLHALALDDDDLLECAAEGGSVEIVRFLLEQGHPVEGHWKPRSKSAAREGHMTPLISAAINAHVEVVRVLLATGANREAKFDGQTALKMLKQSIKHPLDEEDAARIPRMKQIVALLSEAAGPKADEPDNAAAIGQFAANARQPEYQKLREVLAERCGEPRAWQPQPDHGVPAAEVVGYTLARCKRQKTIEDLQETARAAGCTLVLENAWAPGENAELVLFPTADKFAVVAAVGTEGANYSVQVDDVIAWLKQVDGENPINLIVCSHDMVGGAFRQAVKGVRKLAEAIVEICPCCLDEGFKSAEELAMGLKKGRSFLMRWD